MDLYNWLMGQFTHNNFFSAAIISTMLGIASIHVPKLCTVVYYYLLRRCSTYVEFDDRVANYDYFLMWLDKYHSQFNGVSNGIYYSIYHDGLTTAPSIGTHFIWVDNKPVIVTMATNKVGEAIRYHLSARFVFIYDSKIIFDKIDSMRGEYSKKHSHSYLYTVSNGGCSWDIRPGPINRTWDSFVMNQDIKTEIIATIDRFIANKAAYDALNVPHRCGFLFYGPPRTGKSTLIKCIAHYTRKKVYYFTMKELKESNFIYLFSQIDPGSIIVFEDIDCLTTVSRDIESGGEFGISVSTLLNTLDGLLSVDGSIVIMTTNYKDKLDSALLMPGRCDYQYNIDKLDFDSGLTMYLHWTQTLSDVYFPPFTDIVSDVEFPIAGAELQKKLLACINVKTVPHKPL